MGELSIHRDINQPAKRVWEILADFEGVYRFSAGVEASPINAGTPNTGVGAERNCRLYDGNNIQERITQFVDGERLELEVFETSMPLTHAAAQFVVTPRGSGCTVAVDMQYTVKWGVVGRIMNALMLQRAMVGSMTRLLAGLDSYATTGQPIEKGWAPAKAA
ncbi:MAG: hypothetical protein ACI9OJ_003642 [Myxococcota bacterium]|jgi:uncharacterized protein YndB with AHSA1/START domain